MHEVLTCHQCRQFLGVVMSWYWRMGDSSWRGFTLFVGGSILLPAFLKFVKGNGLKVEGSINSLTMYWDGVIAVHITVSDCRDLMLLNNGS
ncbi:hypothetical protein AAC387_Pa03g3067 [Persea americana]